MAEEPKIGLREAYSVETPEDSIELYKDWAATYDEDFVMANGYVAFLRCADLYLQHPLRIAGPVPGRWLRYRRCRRGFARGEGRSGRWH